MDYMNRFCKIKFLLTFFTNFRPNKVDLVLLNILFLIISRWSWFFEKTIFFIENLLTGKIWAFTHFWKHGYLRIQFCELTMFLKCLIFWFSMRILNSQWAWFIKLYKAIFASKREKGQYLESISFYRYNGWFIMSFKCEVLIWASYPYKMTSRLLNRSSLRQLVCRMSVGCCGRKIILHLGVKS